MPKPIVTKQNPNDIVKKSVRKVTGTIADRIEPLTTFTDQYMKILVYGRSKTGKTRFWSTFPGKILGICCSGGNKKGEYKSIPKERHSKIQIISLRTPQELLELIDLYGGTDEYETWVLDHVSGFQFMVLAELLGLDKIPEQLRWGTATQDQYGQCGSTCKEIFRRLLSIEKNVVLVGQERDPKEIKESELLLPQVGVELMPSLAGWLNPAVDYIVQTYKRQRTEERIIEIAGVTETVLQPINGVDYCMRTGPHSVYTTGFRLSEGDLPEYIVNPTWEKIRQIVDGKYRHKKG